MKEGKNETEAVSHETTRPYPTSSNEDMRPYETSQPVRLLTPDP